MQVAWQLLWRVRASTRVSLPARLSCLLSQCQQVLEAMALGEDIPEQEDYGTRPDNEAILRVAGPEIDAFRVRKHCSRTLGESECACSMPLKGLRISFLLHALT